jgi:hypothetical protein
MEIDLDDERTSLIPPAMIGSYIASISFSSRKRKMVL